MQLNERVAKFFYRFSSNGSQGKGERQLHFSSHSIVLVYSYTTECIILAVCKQHEDEEHVGYKKREGALQKCVNHFANPPQSNIKNPQPYKSSPLTLTFSTRRIYIRLQK